ncbi:uncharacterized protein N7496_007707 [Penicillium cataractarum]|uniref:Uncharacterized protein n=1 Tax=Penicillium cataractarum TaxID=2100454 RepID=A0A9W9V428_9EURO|nr:uncharacterized protein N7496_007707 [Penicillium cataractarum]KAJ5367947.1 hypothetical protein N7496_007707 [Penicillium cataractarum]
MTSPTPVPLTTTFSLPAACTTDTWYIEYLSGTNYYDTTLEQLLFPSGYATSTNSYFSPGVAQTENGIVWYSANRCTSYNSDSSYLWIFTKAGITSSMRTAGGINAKAIFIRCTGVSSTVSPHGHILGQSSKVWVAGPVIGAVIAITLIALAVIWYNRRRKYQPKNNENGSQPGIWHDKPELPINGAQVFEAPSDTVPSSKKPAGELSAANAVFELP